MSLKAGRVGVNPADVDPIDGHISPSSVDSYTKVQADAKFETQEDAAALQPKTLAVPIKYLKGSVLGTFTTVQEALSGSYGENGALTNEDLTEKVAVHTTQPITISTTEQGICVPQVNGQYLRWNTHQIVSSHETSQGFLLIPFALKTGEVAFKVVVAATLASVNSQSITIEFSYKEI